MSGRQTVVRVNLGPEVAAILLTILSGSTCGYPEILGDEVLPKKVFFEELAATSGQTSSLATVWHSRMLAPMNGFLELASLIAMSQLTFLHFSLPIYPQAKL